MASSISTFSAKPSSHRNSSGSPRYPSDQGPIPLQPLYLALQSILRHRFFQRFQKRNQKGTWLRPPFVPIRPDSLFSEPSGSSPFGNAMVFGQTSSSRKSGSVRRLAWMPASSPSNRSDEILRVSLQGANMLSRQAVPRVANTVLESVLVEC